MKAFRFRLDSALRWRAAQNDLEKSRVAVAAKRVADIRGALEARQTGLRESVQQLGPVTDGSTLEILHAYRARTQRQIVELEKAAQKAQQDLAAQMKVMLEANRKLRLVENLKETAKTEWQAEFGRELEAFAGESFLGRLQSIKRARSSGG